MEVSKGAIFAEEGMGALASLGNVEGSYHPGTCTGPMIGIAQ